MGVLVFILLFAIAALYGWRTAVGALAARPVSDRVRRAAAMAGSAAPRDFTGADFRVLERVFTVAGALGGAARSAIAIRAYYRVVRALGKGLPILASWSEREMMACSRYLAARIDRSLASNAAHSIRPL